MGWGVSSGCDSSTDYALRLTVVPLVSDRVNPSPAGTVKLLMLTVVQLLAASTSSRELIVAVQAAFAPTTRRAENRKDHMLAEVE